ncbi:hypothetical protein LTR17_011857 [Elasticomyces elasticus]|nr:hypothetical protein LTR17_011857 [Elasticomyces elasticus]
MGASAGHSGSSLGRHEEKLPTRGLNDSTLAGTSTGLGSSSLGGNGGLSQGGLGSSSTSSQGVSGQGVSGQGVSGQGVSGQGVSGQGLDPHVGGEHGSALGHSSRTTDTGLPGSGSQGMGRDDYDNSTGSGPGRESTDNYGTSTNNGGVAVVSEHALDLLSVGLD